MMALSFNRDDKMSKSKIDRTKLKPATKLATAARQYTEHGMVNPAVYRASTVTFDSLEHFESNTGPYFYGRRGTPTSRAIESAIAELEGGFGCKVAPSGLAAISSVLLAFLSPGDHLLMPDCAYGPARTFCDTTLTRLGIETEYYDPHINAAIKRLIRPNTRMIYAECVGSGTMEVSDIPALAAVAHAAGALMVVDNTWSGGLFFDAFAHGCDISLQAATKYITGHSDCMFGTVVCTEKTWPRYKENYETMGLFAGPDDMYLALRGLRTLSVRMERQMKSAIKIADWLRQQPQVTSVLYPALPNDPGHTLWKRDFTGAAGLFSLTLKPTSKPGLAALLDGLALFSLGYSWGGFESLIVPVHLSRSQPQRLPEGPLLRLSIGLEDPDDLISDLEQGFERLKKVS
jgi:cystathionine beta-lyase